VNVRVLLLAAAVPLALAVSAFAGASAGDTIVFGLHVKGKPDRAIVMRADGTGPRAIPLRAPSCAGCIHVSPDGTQLLTAAAAGKRITTAVEGLDGSGYHALPLPGHTLNLGPGAWSRNGRRIAFEGWGSDRVQNGLYDANVDGTALRRLTKSPGGDHDIPLVYSPNGAWLLFARSKTADDSDPADLFAVSSSGGRVYKLNPAGTDVRWGFGSPASWSADSRTVAFAALDDTPAADAGRSALFTVTPRGRDVRRITPWGVWTTSARFSPDGAWIAFDRLHDGLSGHDLLVVRPDGSGTRTVVNDARDGIGSCCARWSPDGEALVFQRGDAAAATLWTVHTDGTGLKEVSSTAGEYPFYAWVR
jgi:Tol biopolymer transport system component